MPAASGTKSSRGRRVPRARSAGVFDIVRQLAAIEGGGDEGVLRFAPRRSLHVSSLDKPFFPRDGITKGDLMRYYASVAGVLLPIIKDRPVILKRYPDGIEGPSFFQQNPGQQLPAPVRRLQPVHPYEPRGPD